MALEPPGSVAPGSGILRKFCKESKMVDSSERGGGVREGGEEGDREVKTEGGREEGRKNELEPRVLLSEVPSHRPPAAPRLLKFQLGPKPSIPEPFVEMFYIREREPRRIISHTYQTKL